MTTAPGTRAVLLARNGLFRSLNSGDIRIRLALEGKVRDLALFHMALDSKLQGCDPVKRKVTDVADGHAVLGRATVLQQKKTGSSVQFEVTKGTRETVAV